MTVPPKSRRPLLWPLFVPFFAATLAAALLFGWALWPGPGGGSALLLDLPAAISTGELSELLRSRGAITNADFFRWYLAIFQAHFAPVPGSHLLSDGACPRELALRLERSSLRGSERVTVPEGFQHLQIGERLEQAQVCGLSAFRQSVTDTALLRELGIPGASAEGYLFPATYGLLLDSDAREVVRVFVAETRRRLAKLSAEHPGRLEQLSAEDGFSEHDVLTLASMIEKEGRVADERPLIASVFFNRLKDPDFRPARMLQSDPTASYGCLVLSPSIPSCSGFRGSVTPALLRDAANPYNTYRHAGLPPGPIANPGAAAIEAVLAPARTKYLYFVAKGQGRHSFSRTFAEHREAVESVH